MPSKTWTLEKAKNSFSAVVAAAERGEPQLVTKRGRPAAYVVSAEEFQRLRDGRETPKDDFIQHLLSAPKRPEWMSDEEDLFPREPFVDRPPYEFEE